LKIAIYVGAGALVFWVALSYFQPPPPPRKCPRKPGSQGIFAPAATVPVTANSTLFGPRS